MSRRIVHQKGLSQAQILRWLAKSACLDREAIRVAIVLWAESLEPGRVSSDAAVVQTVLGVVEWQIKKQIPLLREAGLLITRQRPGRLTEIKIESDPEPLMASSGGGVDQGGRYEAE